MTVLEKRVQRIKTASGKALRQESERETKKTSGAEQKGLWWVDVEGGCMQHKMTWDLEKDNSTRDLQAMQKLWIVSQMGWQAIGEFEKQVMWSDLHF